MNSALLRRGLIHPLLARPHLLPLASSRSCIYDGIHSAWFASTPVVTTSPKKTDSPAKKKSTTDLNASSAPTAAEAGSVPAEASPGPEDASVKEPPGPVPAPIVPSSQTSEPIEPSFPQPVLTLESTSTETQSIPDATAEVPRDSIATRDTTIPKEPTETPAPQIATSSPLDLSTSPPSEIDQLPSLQSLSIREDIYNIMLNKLDSIELRSCNAILELLAARGEVEGLANALKERGLEWDSFTYEALIRDAVRRKDPDRARHRLDEMRAKTLIPTSGSLNAVIIGLARADRLDDAEIALKELGDVPAEAGAFAALMGAHARAAKKDALGRLRGLVDYLKKFYHAVQIDVELPVKEKLNRAIRALLREGFDLTLTSLHALGRADLALPTPDPELYDLAIVALLDLEGCDSAARARKLLDEIAGAGLSATIATYNRVLEALPDGVSAHKLLQDMLESGPQPTSESFNAVIALYVADGRPKMARRVEEEMIKMGVAITTRTYDLLSNGGPKKLEKKGGKKSKK
ncbi:hypothetical protein BDK51DRAFT_41685 [Blyttiomyces helicus]|uniref:Pentacotripeptide-repeat region of PRORP domain-containing protein n=1 Tax=Blyttiomyces helicus TaxID=388810 RepID=A0A4P9WE67_9FUNG|nr:hypothetical protein BDK51DRAFT_41685 [Blyttiomyces helicus]|eukprot:RKO91009.1 hypothetical protein BDK51DRAFT_41685 [Blyttiomyces helicus]